MSTTADLEERAIWKRAQAGSIVTTHPGHSYILSHSSGHTIATLTSLDELRAGGSPV